MSESSKRHSKFLSLIFILKCLSKASVIRISIVSLFLWPHLDLSIVVNKDKLWIVWSLRLWLKEHDSYFFLRIYIKVPKEINSFVTAIKLF